MPPDANPRRSAVAGAPVVEMGATATRGGGRRRGGLPEQERPSGGLGLGVN